MALAHKIVETRLEYNRWITKLNVTDSDTGKVYNHRFQSKTDPGATRLTELAALAKDSVQYRLDIDSNAMNLMTDEDRLLGYYRGIKRDIILRIRQFPGATAQQARDYIATEYPDSPFGFDQLYAIWIGMINVSTWAEFKAWVINHKFRDID